MVIYQKFDHVFSDIVITDISYVVPISSILSTHCFLNKFNEIENLIGETFNLLLCNRNCSFFIRGLFDLREEFFDKFPHDFVNTLYFLDGNKL